MSVLASSSVYETEPVGRGARPARVPQRVPARSRPSSSPRRCSTPARRSSASSGREPGGPRHGPRPIDVDVLLLGDAASTRPTRLALPARRGHAPALRARAAARARPGAERCPTARALADALAALGPGQDVRRAGPPLRLDAAVRRGGARDRVSHVSAGAVGRRCRRRRARPRSTSMTTSCSQPRAGTAQRRSARRCCRPARRALTGQIAGVDRSRSAHARPSRRGESSATRDRRLRRPVAALLAADAHGALAAITRASTVVDGIRPGSAPRDRPARGSSPAAFIRTLAAGDQARGARRQRRSRHRQR